MAALILVISGAIGLGSYYIASNAVIKNVDDMLPQIAEESSTALENLIRGKLESLHITANNIGESASEAVQRLFLEDQQEKGEYMLLGTADLNGNMIGSNGIVVSVREYDFFQRAINGQDTASEPMADIFNETSDETSDLILVYAVPTYKTGVITGALIAVRPADELLDFIDSIEFGETGSAFLINEQGEMIAHNDRSLVAEKTNFIREARNDSSYESVAEIMTTMIDGEIGVGEYRFEGEDKYAGFAPVESTSWSLAVAGEKGDILSGLVPLRIFIILLTVALLIIGTLVIYYIANSLTKKIDVIVDSLGYMAKGDLTKEIPGKFLKDKGEIGELSVSIDKTQKSFREMLEQIREGSNDTDSQAENLSAISEQITSASENVAAAIQGVARGAGSQAQNLSDMTEALNDFSKDLETIVHAIQDIDNSANDISAMSTASNEEIETLMASSNRISGTFNEFVDKINGFNENVKQIDEIAAVINGIADETNLLALNAAIEAARSGEAGRGFAVVAEQIRKLAEETKTSSNNINDIVRGIADNSEIMVSDTENVGKGLNEQVEILDTTIESFESINKAIGNIVNEIEAVNSSAFQLDGKKNEIVEGIGEVASISEEVSSSSEEIAASSEEMNASMEEIAASSEVLRQSTEDTMKQLRRFKLLNE